MSFILDPQARLDYAFDWREKTNGTNPTGTDWLATDETISTFTVTATPGVTIDGAPTQAAGKVTVWLKDGVDGAVATVTCHIVTSAGREDDRSLTVRVANR